MTTEELIGQILLGIIIFLYGIVIGSFLNVCIYRIPLKESLSKEPSHCMKCGYRLRWYDLVPVFSYLFLGGKCRNCREHISMQYPIVESANGILYVLIYLLTGWSINLAIYCLLMSALLVLGVIDVRNSYVTNGINIFILTLGLIHLGVHLGDWVSLVAGLFVVSTILEVSYRITKGKFFGYDKVNLARVLGLLLGFRLSVVAALAALLFLAVVTWIKKNATKRNTAFPRGSWIGFAAAAGSFAAVVIGKWI